NYSISDSFCGSPIAIDVQIDLEQAAQPNCGFTVTTDGVTSESDGAPYTGSVPELTTQYVNLTPEALCLTATAPNSFIAVEGSAGDAIQAGTGYNVISCASGSNFLSGGSGMTTFFTYFGGASNIWDTITNFKAGDEITIWDVTPDVVATWV